MDRDKFEVKDPRGYTLSMLEIRPIEDNITAIHLPNISEDEKNNFLDSYPETLWFWDSEGIYGLNSDITTLEEMLDEEELFWKEKNISTDNPILYHALRKKMEETIIGKGYNIFGRYQAYDPERKIEIKDSDLRDILALYNGFEWRIKTWNDILTNEIFFALCIDHHLRVKFDLNMAEVIAKLSQDMSQNRIRKALRGFTAVNYQEREWKVEQEALRGRIGDIFFYESEEHEKIAQEHFNEPRLKAPIIEFTGNSRDEYAPASALSPESHGETLSGIIDLLNKGKSKGREAHNLIKEKTFMRSEDGRQNKNASKDRFKAIVKELEGLFEEGDLKLGDSRFRVSETTIELNILTEEEFIRGAN